MELDLPGAAVDDQADVPEDVLAAQRGEELVLRRRRVAVVRQRVIRSGVICVVVIPDMDVWLK